MITTTSYGSWVRRVEHVESTVEATVEASLDAWPGIDVDAVTDAYRDAINAALPDSVQFCGDEFYGPAYAADCADQADYPHDEDGRLDINAVIHAIDFWAIVERIDGAAVTA